MKDIWLPLESAEFHRAQRFIRCALSRPGIRNRVACRPGGGKTTPEQAYDLEGNDVLQYSMSFSTDTRIGIASVCNIAAISDNPPGNLSCLSFGLRDIKKGPGRGPDT